MKIKLGTIGHFGLSVRDPRASARWWKALVDFREEPWSDGDVVGLSNRDVTMVLMRGVPRPKTIGHISFHLRNAKALRDALALLKRRHVSVEDPGDEIGPEAPGSKNIGLWFCDPDGYRWELSVLARSRR
jgi:catechol 2,3-dioxygenase-like lactoylglutathione lyase family enzyme